jgi:hypothetical protein
MRIAISNTVKRTIDTTTGASAGSRIRNGIKIGIARLGTRVLLATALIGTLGTVAATTASAQVYVRPGYVQTAVVVVAPGYYGDRYYDGRRYWARRDWERRHWRGRDRRYYGHGYRGHRPYR